MTEYSYVGDELGDGLVHCSSCCSKRWFCDEGWRGDAAGVSESMAGRGSL